MFFPVLARLSTITQAPALIGSLVGEIMREAFRITLFSFFDSSVESLFYGALNCCSNWRAGAYVGNCRRSSVAILRASFVFLA